MVPGSSVDIVCSGSKSAQGHRYDITSDIFELGKCAYLTLFIIYSKYQHKIWLNCSFSEISIPPNCALTYCCRHLYAYHTLLLFLHYFVHVIKNGNARSLNSLLRNSALFPP